MTTVTLFVVVASLIFYKIRLDMHASCNRTQLHALELMNAFFLL